MTEKNTKMKVEKGRNVIVGLHGDGWDYEFSFPSTGTVDILDLAKCQVALDEYHKFMKTVRQEAEKCNRDYAKTIEKILDNMPDDRFIKIYLLGTWDESFPEMMEELCGNDIRLGFSLLKSKLSSNSERKRGLEILRGESLGLSLSKISVLSKIPEEELLKLIERC